MAALAENKSNWIDYDAMKYPDTERFVDYIMKAASGEEVTANERNDFREIAIFKSGVTL